MDYLNEHAKSFSFAGKDKACLLIHGFTGSPAHMKYLGEFLHQEGNCEVNGILLPGHGTKLEDMERTDWNDWLNAAKSEYEKLAKEFKEVYVMGLSMGGVLSLLLAEEYDLTGVIPIAAPIRIHNKLAYLSPLLKFFKRFDSWDEDDDKDKYDVGYPAAPIASVPDLLKLMKRAEKNLFKIKAPALIVQSHMDKTVKPVSAQMIYDGISSSQKDILWLEKAGHVCTISSEKSRIHEEILNFIERS